MLWRLFCWWLFICPSCMQGYMADGKHWPVSRCPDR